jgi:predicted GIY-YIG superfamily endonuclease
MTSIDILQSERDTAKHYVGSSNDPVRRIDEHNGGTSLHTNKYQPWKIIV